VSTNGDSCSEPSERHERVHQRPCRQRLLCGSSVPGVHKPRQVPLLDEARGTTPCCPPPVQRFVWESSGAGPVQIVGNGDTAFLQTEGLGGGAESNQTVHLALV